MRRELEQVRKKAERAETAQAELRRAVVAAHRTGASLRAISEATGRRISHTTVAEIIRAEGGGERDVS